jgi:enolase-phosphatase E1
VSVSLHDRGIRVVLLDIEGTTTPMAFVYEVLFPYARARLASYLRAHITAEDLRDELATLRVEWQEEARKGEEPPPWALADVPAAARYLEWLMDRDRKSPGLKLLQGQIWEQGYRSGELHGDVFGDVAPALRRWHDAGIVVAIYSSGSELAQRLLFGSTSQGDLTPLIDRFFDTAVGAKQAPDSYRRIARELGRPADEILFISDVTTELEAARSAGCQTLLCVRPGNRPQSPGSHRAVRSFDDVAV